MEEKKLIYSKLIDISRSISHIGKDRKNAQQGYVFRGIDDMYNSLHETFAQNGVLISSEVLTVSREERSTKSGGALIYTCMNVKFTFIAEDGSSVCSTMVGEGMDSGDKSSNKAMSVALKYALMQMFLIPTEGGNTDPESDNHEPKSLKQEALDLIEKCQSVEDLTEVKGMYIDTFKKFPDVVSASREKFNSLSKNN